MKNFRFHIPTEVVFGNGAENSTGSLAAKKGIERTVAFFKSIGMPTSLSDLDIEINEADVRQLALDATDGNTLRLSKIRPLDAEDIEEIYLETMA